MRLPLALVVLASGAAGLACNFNQEGVAPPNNQFFFPGAAVLDPLEVPTPDLQDPTQQQWLYVANANADLRFNNGTLVAVNVLAAQSDRHAGQVNRSTFNDCTNVTFTARPALFDPANAADITKHCCWDQLDSNILDCDERAYMDTGATVRIGSFSSAMVLQQKIVPMDQPPQSRLLIAVRGNTSITVVDTEVNAQEANQSCTGTGDPTQAVAGAFPVCDTNHQITVNSDTPSDARLTLLDEPYALAIDEGLEALYVGHLKGGFISFFDLSGYQTQAFGTAGNLPTLVSVSGSIFPADVNGAQGVTSLTVQIPGLGGRVYATSRFVPRASAVAPITRDPALTGPPSVTNPDTILANAGDVFVTSLSGSETRGIQFVPGAAGDRAFVLQRTPPALVGFDHDQVLNTPSDVIEVCTSPTFLNKPVLPNGLIRLYVTCFDAGEIYVIDPFTARIVTIIDAGRGPAGLNFTTNGEFAYVTGFGANNISVIDLRQGSTTENRVVQRIGFPSAVPL